MSYPYAKGKQFFVDDLSIANLYVSNGINTTGSIISTGNDSQITGSFSGSLDGNASTSTTASYSFKSSVADTTISASYASTASYFSGTVISSSYSLSSSYANNAISASYASSSSFTSTSSFSLNNISSSYSSTSSFNISSSYSLNSTSASYINTASYSNNSLTSSYSITSSYNKNAETSSYNLNSISSSYSNSSISSSYSVSSSYSNSSNISISSSISNLANTASYILTASYSINSLNSISASYASNTSTASYLNSPYVFSFNLRTGSVTLISSDITAIGNTIYAPITGSTNYIQNQTASIQTVSFNINGKIGIGTNNPTSSFHIEGNEPTITLIQKHAVTQSWQLISGTAIGNTTFEIYNATAAKTGMAIGADGEFRIGSRSNIIANGSRLYIFGGVNGANVDAQGDAALLNGDQSCFEAEAADYQTTGKSIAIRYFGSSLASPISVLGISALDLSVLDFGLSGTSIIRTSNNTPIILGINNSEILRFTSSGITIAGTGQITIPNGTSPSSSINLSQISNFVVNTTTIAGFSLSGSITLANHVAGTGLTGNNYNGSTNQTWNNNLSTGISGGQLVIGSTSTNSGLIIQSTTGIGATGADIIFKVGNNGATEVARILNSGFYGIGTSIPTSVLTIEQNNLGPISGSLSTSLILQNTASAILGSQQVSPAIVFSSNGWNTGGSSQNTAWRIQNLPIQGSTISSTLQFQQSSNNGSFSSVMTLTTAGILSAINTLICSAGGTTTSAFTSAATLANANFNAITQGISSVTTTKYLWASSPNTNYRIALGAGNTSTALIANGNYASVIIPSAPLTSATSGTTSWASNLSILAMGTYTTGSSTVTNSSTVYIDGASSFATNNYSLFINSGPSKFGGVVGLKGYTVSTLPIGNIGDTAYVTDALAPTFGNTLIGGGFVVAKAFFNGTNWIME